MRLRSDCCEELSTEASNAGCSEPVDTVKTSLFVSTHLDGLIVAASVRFEYDLRAGFLQMRKISLRLAGL